jgi:uncharacterized protein (TIGR02444 family)
MDAAGLTLDGRLWTFAVALYARDGVAEACLALQDGFGMDVSLLLFAAWTGADAGLALTPEQARFAVQRSSEWRSEVVAVLRSLRRLLKAGPAPAPSPATDDLREAVKGVELAAERIELAWLERIAETFSKDGTGAPAGRGDPAMNLALCFETAAARPPNAEARAKLQLLAEAATALVEGRA